MALDSIANLYVDLSIRSSNIEQGLNKLNKKFADFANKQEKSAERVKRSTERSSRSILQMRRSFDTALRGIAGSFAIRELIQFSRGMAAASINVQLLNQRVKVFTGNSAGFGLAFEAAQKLGVAVENVATGMGRIVAVGSQMGVTTAEAQKMTTTFQQLALLSGSTVKESQAAFIQFTQALGANRLSGEELRSIREQAPLVAQAIAKSMGIATGDIKKVAEEGKITAAVMRKAMAEAAEDAERMFASLPVSIERQEAAWKNAWMRLLVGLDTVLHQSDAWKFLYGTITPFAQGMSATMVDVSMLTPSELNEEISRLQEQTYRTAKAIQDIKNLPDSLKYQPGVSDNLNSLTEGNRADLLRLAAAMEERQKRVAQTAEEINAANKALREADFDAWFKGLDRLKVEITSKRIEPTAMEKLYEDMDELTRTELQKQKAAWEQFVVTLEEQLANGRLGAGQAAIEEFNRRWLEGLERVGGLQEVKVTAEKIFPKAEQAKFNEFAAQAARNMQSAFADFLFDPFENGLKGMLKSFIDTIRRMVAEIMAQKILTAMFTSLGGMFSGGIGSFFNSMAGGLAGKRAAGGPVGAGKTYLVGERGPELFVPGTSGRIIPGGGGGVMVAPVYNIDARGATQDLAKQLPGILAAHARQTVEMARRAINDDVSRGAFGRA